ncbi:MAG: phosphoribosylglycinamide formyltransferase [Nitrososphaerota archaeon]
MKPVRIAVMASRRGSNFRSILDHIRLGVLKGCEVAALVTNRAGCGAVKVAEEHGVPVLYRPVEGTPLNEWEKGLVDALRDLGVDLLVLAGWDWMVGGTLISQFRWRMMAIHPSLHPSFTGTLMRAEEVHRKVLESGVKVTGCTVYYVDSNVDTGPIIAQRAVEIGRDIYELFFRDPEAAVSELGRRVLLEEHLLLPKAIQLHVEGRIRLFETEHGTIAVPVYDEGWEEEWERRQSGYLKVRGLSSPRGVAQWPSS